MSRKTGKDLQGQERSYNIFSISDGNQHHILFHFDIERPVTAVDLMMRSPYLGLKYAFTLPALIAEE